MQNWRPGANNQVLQLRAQLYRRVRDFFDQRRVLEVETPLLCQAAVADPNIQPISAAGRFLHTSPEYAMKRLLSAGSGDIYQIAKVFRQGEAGHKHNPEFSMLEWYRVGWNHWQLMDEVADLCDRILPQAFPRVHISYTEALQQFAGIDWPQADVETLRQIGRQLAGADLQLDADGWLDIIMSHQVEPALPEQTLVFIYDYPESQAALAKVRCDNDIRLAERFELYLNGVELANGYHELTDATEQRRRFLQHTSEAMLDNALLQALAAGMPDCSGVAMGLDRILMLLSGNTHIDDVLSFSWLRA